MSELKHKMSTRSSKQISAEPIVQQTSKQIQPSKSKPKNGGVKKSLQQKSLFSMGFKKEQSEIIPEPTEVLYTIKQLLKQASITEIIQQCPKVKQLHQLLRSKLYNKQKLVLATLDKYFHGNTTSLWYNKYAPRQFNQLFQSDFAQKIQEWIKDFYYFRKEAHYDQQSDFINDQSQQSYSKSLQLRMRQYGWNCRALVLKGRNGVGKNCLINAIAKSMNIRCFQYASDVDQLQKMRQMTDGSQSECVDKYQNKKKQQQNNKIIKQNSFITKFMPLATKKQSLETKHPKRMQIFRNFNQYFPPCDRVDKQGAQDNYFRQLSESINKSPIPYVLTSSKDQIFFRQKHLNQKFSKFDYIEFVQNSVEDLTYLYWTVYQIQSNFSLNTSKKIPKIQLFNQLNQQFKNLQIKLIDNMHLIRELINKSNKKPLYVAKYLQFLVLLRIKFLKRQKQLNLQPNKEQQKLPLLQNAIRQIGSQIAQNISSDDLINNMQWSIYDRTYQQPSPFDQTAASQQLQGSQKSSEFQLQKKKRPKLKDMIKKLDLLVSQDRKVYQNQYYFYKSKQSQTINSEYYEDNYYKIPTKIHRDAKKKLFKSIKLNISTIHHQRQKWQKKTQIFKLNMNEKQLYYLPLLFVSNGTTRRSSRNNSKQSNKQSTQQNLNKIMTLKQLAYFKKFGKYVLVQ